MNKTQAARHISDLFQNKFDRVKYTWFLRNLLNEITPGQRQGQRHSGSRLPDAYKKHINQYWCLGKYIDPNGEEVDLQVVEVDSPATLDRARTKLRNFAINRLTKFEKDFGLFAFYAKEDGGEDWRFSYVKIEHSAKLDDATGKVKLDKELTPAKRYSFLVGKHENSHTAQAQLVDLLEMDYANPTVEDIEKAFSIEKVTREFFEQYKDLFVRLSEVLAEQSHFQKEADEEKRKQIVAKFAKKLLGQIVFLYFLQKKGWLGVKEGEDWGKGERRFLQKLFDDADESGQNYYVKKLQFLFYEALANDRKDQFDPSYYQRFACRIPFLNGGLFEADYDWQKITVDIPNSIFSNEEKNKAGDEGTGILDVFNRYNFTIKEDEPLEKEVAIDPEMLGKVFENMLEITERKSKGAFYTPREIVHYMCQESLIHYLCGEVEKQTSSSVSKDDIETLVRKGIFAIENDERILAKGKETDKYKFKLPQSIRDNAGLIDARLADIKICDPAIGSGAFPVGMLHEIVHARQALAPHLPAAKRLRPYDLKKHTIAHSIYGVDIDPSAIDIARLRLWLSLVVDEDDYNSIDALPNLDYKIVRGNSLIGFPEHWESPAFQTIEDLKKQFFAETNHDKKIEQKSQIDAEIQKRMINSKQVFGYKIDFDFRLVFSEVWHHRRGFDIVIGNPPYVDSEEMTRKNLNRNKMKELYKSTKGNWDLFVPFIEKGVTITAQSGVFSYIIPNKLISAKYAEQIRKYLSDYQIHEIRDYSGVKVFKEAAVYPITIVLTKSTNQLSLVKTTKMSDSLTCKSANLIESEMFCRDTHWSKYFFEKKIWETIEKISDNDCLTSLDVNVLGAATVAEAYKVKKLLVESSEHKSFKFINTGTIDRYASLWGMSDTQYIKDSYQKPLVENESLQRMNNARYSQAKSKKIILAGMSKGIEAFLDSNGEYYAGKSTIIILGNEVDLAAITAILNSELISFYVNTNYHSMKMSGGYINISKYIVSNIPVPGHFHNAWSSTKAISTCVRWLHQIKKHSSRLVFSYFDQLIDGLVYELYFPEEIKAAGKELLPHLGTLTPLTDDMSEEEKLAVIQQEFERLYDPNHPVRNHLETLDCIEEIRIIREALKK